jgi:serine/threonine protein kinase/tetratricopeptide (TPR) repeat protein/phosphoribosyl 1,2-cyclic phosphodiesterase/anti-anti-sigma regulatory factor
MQIRIWGARGSIPSPIKSDAIEEKIFQAISQLPPDLNTRDSEAVRAYIRQLPQFVRGTAGGNTTCVEIQANGNTIIIDAGSGLRELGHKLMKGPCGKGKGHIHFLFTHTHWDHVQGFPFFLPAYIPGNKLTFHSLHDVHDALTNQQVYCYFPLPLAEMKADMEFIEIEVGKPFFIGKTWINTIENAHPGKAYSFRLEDEHSVFVFASDSEYKLLDSASLQPHIKFFHGADALIFDAQYTLRESWQKADWGHSSALIGVDMARAAKVKRLILFHHDPTYSDQELEEILETAVAYQKQEASLPATEIIIGHEGLALDLSPPGIVDVRYADTGDTAIVVPERIFNHDTVHQLIEQLQSAVSINDAGPKSSIIDLSHVDTLTLAGLKALVDLRQQHRETPIILVAPSSAIEQVITLGNYTDYFAFYPNLESAQAAIHAREALNLPGHIVNEKYKIQKNIYESQLIHILKATRLADDKSVALKIFDPSLRATTTDRLIRQTQQLIGQSHPNLATLYDWEQDGEYIFQVEEFIENQSLGHLLKEGQPAPAELTKKVIQGILLALEFAHSRGVIHGGIMPYNIFVNGDQVRLTSYGIGRIEEGRQLLNTPLFVLKAPYLAPEHLLGQPLDTRTDLYLLGIILYRLMTGQMPFTGSDQDIKEAHLHRSPKPPSLINPEISTFLEHLILKLLNKNPNNRYASARQVLRIWTSLGTSPELITQHTFMPLTGRESTFDQILNCWRESRQGQGQIIFISGEPGIGKSSLAQAVAFESQASVVLTGRSRGRNGAAYHLFSDILNNYFATVPPELFEDTNGTILSALSQLVPEIRQAAPNLPKLWTLEPEQEQIRLMGSLTKFIEQATRNRPWLLILEDLQWADQSSLELLRYLGRHVSGMPLMILGLYQDTELEQGHPLSELFRDLTNSRAYHQITLERLNQDGVEQLLGNILQLSVDNRITQRIYEQTGGNPLYVEEVAKEILDSSQISENSTDFYIPREYTLPDSVQEIVKQRVARLNPETQKLLSQAAVLGQTFSFHHLQLMNDMKPRQLLELLDTALERQLIQEVPGEGTLRFSHIEIRRVLYNDLGHLRRQILHRQAGEALEKQVAPYQDRIVGELARHFDKAGDYEKAIHYGLKAARQSQLAYANEQALTDFNRVFEIMASIDPDELPNFDTQRFFAHKYMGEVLMVFGRYDEALAHFESAWAVYPQQDIPEERAAHMADLCRLIADVYQRRNYYDQAFEWLAKGINFISHLEPGNELVQIYNLYGWTHMRQGEYIAAGKQLEQALELAQSLDLRQAEASSLRHLGTAYWYQEKFAQATKQWEKALEVCQQLGDRFGSGKVLNNLGLVANEIGNYEAAKDYLEQSLEILQETGTRWLEFQVNNNLGDALTCLGLYEEARERLEAALQSCHQLGDRQIESMILSNLSVLFWQMEEFETARAYSNQAISIARALDNPRQLAYGQLCLGYALLSLNRTQAAQEAFEESINIRRSIDQPSLLIGALAGLAAAYLAFNKVDQAMELVEEILERVKISSLTGNKDPLRIYLVCYRTLDAKNDPRAEEIAGRAYTQLQSQAAMFKDQALSQTFLEKVRTNREIIALYRQSVSVG